MCATYQTSPPYSTVPYTRHLEREREKSGTYFNNVVCSYKKIERNYHYTITSSSSPKKRSYKNKNKNKKRKGRIRLIPNHPKQKLFKITINNSLKPPRQIHLKFLLIGLLDAVHMVRVPMYSDHPTNKQIFTTLIH